MAPTWLALLVGCDRSQPLDAATDLQVSLHPDVASMVYVSWTQSRPTEAHVEYSFDDGEWLSSPTAPAGPGENRRLLVGIPFDVDVAVRLVRDGEPTVDGPGIHTGPIPELDGKPIPGATLGNFDPAGVDPQGNYLITSIADAPGNWVPGNYWTIVLDRQGRLVWARATPKEHWTLFVTVDPYTHDHFLWDEATSATTSFGDDGADSLIHSATLDEEGAVTATPGLHHGFVELPDGTLAWGSQMDADSATEALVERGPLDTESRVLWSCDQDWPGSGDCNANGLTWDAATDRYLYSFYTNDSVVEVDRTTGETGWWAGGVPGGYAFAPPDAQFAWQHGLSVTDDGHLLLSTRGTADDGVTSTTLAREYEIDAAAATLRDTWHCDAGVLSATNGDASRLPGGNTLHLLGSAGAVREYQPDCTVVWALDFGPYLLGKGELVDDLYTLVGR